MRTATAVTAAVLASALAAGCGSVRAPGIPGAPVSRVTARCPATDKGIAGVTNQGADLPRRLLPAAAPTAGLECRYYGLNGRPFRLRSQTRLTAAAASKVARSMQRLPLSHTVGGVSFCPMDDEASEIIALSYAGRPAVDLQVKLNGCRFVENGFIQAGLY